MRPSRINIRYFIRLGARSTPSLTAALRQASVAERPIALPPVHCTKRSDSCTNIASIPFAMMDTFQASNASNVPTREKQSKKRGNLQTARMARFGRETALSRDFLTLRKRLSKVRLPARVQ